MPEFESTNNNDCSTLSFVTTLASPVASAIIALKIGDILQVEMVAPASLRLFDSNGVLVGSLLTKYRDTILDCISKGTNFQATVTRIIGGNCDVRIKSR